jgi:glycosyltransferase involved in cell wall biosynthesis
MTFNTPINSVSFGNVAYCLIREYFSRGNDFNFIPIGNVDLSSYKEEPDFKAALDIAAKRGKFNHNRKDTTIRLWHLDGSYESVSDQRNLITFHETSELTQFEKNVLDQQDVVFVTSTYTKKVFEAFGVKCKVVYMPLGFDSRNFGKLNKKYYDDGSIVFGLFAKMEGRKNTLRVLSAWAKKYGNNKKYRLHAAISNPFIPVEQQAALINNALGGQKYWNINFLPFFGKNEQYNDVLNSIDIDLTGMSSCEGFNLPAFHTTCLGKWGVFLNAHVHADYANADNAILVEPSGFRRAEDGMFFRTGHYINQGMWVDFKDEDLIQAMEAAEKKAKTPNTLGEALKEKFNYQKTLDCLLGNV